MPPKLKMAFYCVCSFTLPYPQNRVSSHKKQVLESASRHNRDYEKTDLKAKRIFQRRRGIPTRESRERSLLYHRIWTSTWNRSGVHCTICEHSALWMKAYAYQGQVTHLGCLKWHWWQVEPPTRTSFLPFLNWIVLYKCKLSVSVLAPNTYFSPLSPSFFWMYSSKAPCTSFPSCFCLIRNNKNYEVLGVTCLKVI